MHNMTQTDHFSELAGALGETLSRCTQCGTCVKHCPFLQRYGNPHHLAEKYARQQLEHEVPFLCSLCRLCTVVCPEKLDPGQLFWLMRCRQAEEGIAGSRHHKTILRYEKWGLSGLFSLFALPRNCQTVLFPGCTFPGTRPKQLHVVFKMLQETIPDVGLVLSCCAKPSHDLGRTDSFQRSFKRILRKLLDGGVRNVLTLCPSCYQIFKQYGTGLDVGMVYKQVAEKAVQDVVAAGTAVTVHDPCGVRLDPEIHADIRNILARRGLRIVEMPHSGKHSLCCGEGGSACFLPGNTAGQLGRIREGEADGHPVVAYCAGCTDRFSRLFPCHHLVDLLLDPEATLNGTIKTSRPPFTYVKRLLVKLAYMRRGDLSAGLGTKTPGDS